MKNKLRKVVWATLVPLLAAGFAAGYWVKHQAVAYRTRTDAVVRQPSGTRFAGLQVEGPPPLDLIFQVFTHLRHQYVDEITDQTALTYGVLRGMAGYFHDPEVRFMEPDETRRYLNELSGKYEGVGAAFTIRRVAEPVTDPDMRHELDKLVKQYQEEGHEVGEGASAFEDLGFTPTSITKRFLVIGSTVPGGPADKAGLLPGDQVEMLDGKWVISYQPTLDLLKTRTDYRNRKIKRSEYLEVIDKLQKRLEGAYTPGEARDALATATKPIKLAVHRKGADELVEVTVQPREASEPSAAWEDFGDGYGYLRITSFGPEAPALTRSALNSLGSKGVRRLVVDLRNNTMGKQAEMLEIAGMLLGPKEVAKVQTREGDERLASVSVKGEPFAGKVVVLVNRGTAGLAEVLAAALSEQASADLLGRNTAGDPMAADLIEMDDGSAVRIIVGKYFTSKGRDFTDTGLRIDKMIAGADRVSAPRSDPAVKAAVEFLKSGGSGA